MRVHLAKLLAGAALTTLLVALPSRAAAQEVTTHRVVISLNEQGELQYSLDPVVAYPGDRVVFSAPGMQSWTVTFRGATPFADRVISGTGTQERNVPILPNTAAGTYSYDVSVTRDGETVVEDPDIIVRDRGGDAKPGS